MDVFVLVDLAAVDIREAHQATASALVIAARPADLAAGVAAEFCWGGYLRPRTAGRPDLERWHISDVAGASATKISA
jgi:hypothetical protein